MNTKEQLRVRSTLLIIVESIYLSLGSFYTGYNIAVFNQSQSCIEIIHEWSPSDKNFYDGLLTSLLPLGAIFGSSLTGVLSEKFGKRLCLIIIDLIGIIGSFIMIFKGAPLFIGRFITGIVAGANTVTVSSYINEISPISLIAKTGSIISIMINFGIFFAFIMGLNLPNEAYMFAHKDELKWWKFMLTLPAITCLIRIFFLICLVKTDTPEYYINAKRDEDAKTVLRKYYDEQFVETVFINLKNKLENKTKLNIRDLFNYKFKKRLTLGLLLSSFQQFSGINAVIFYSNEIFMNQTEGNDYQAKIFTTIIGVILIIAAYLSGKFIDKFGRKTIFLQGQFFCSLMLFFLLLCGYLSYETPIIFFILIYIMSFGLSLGPVLWVYLPEILPEKGVGLASMANWFSCFMVGLLFPILVQQIKIYGCFLIFCVLSVLGLFFIKIAVLETQHKTKEEIEDMFMNEIKDEDQNHLKS